MPEATEPRARRSVKHLPPLKRLRELLDLDPSTGRLTWRRSGKPAFATPTGNGYLRGKIDGESYLAHRIVWKMDHGFDPPENIDHELGNGTDNTPDGLRSASQAVNRRNSRRSSRNRSGVTGVSWAKHTGRWRAVIVVDGRQTFLGYFEDFAEAVRARKSAAAANGFTARHGCEV